MSDRTDGQHLYETGDVETNAWFHRQWLIWPFRAHEDRTTNLSFHHGAVEAYRIEHGKDPEMSQDFRSAVAVLDRLHREAQP